MPVPRAYAAHSEHTACRQGDVARTGCAARGRRGAAHDLATHLLRLGSAASDPPPPPSSWVRARGPPPQRRCRWAAVGGGGRASGGWQPQGGLCSGPRGWISEGHFGIGKPLWTTAGAGRRLPGIFTRGAPAAAPPRSSTGPRNARHCDLIVLAANWSLRWRAGVGLRQRGWGVHVKLIAKGGELQTKGRRGGKDCYSLHTFAERHRQSSLFPR